ncbi:Transcription factor IIIA [Habropoda laboriosa]|uniref:Transcription factor IIIA n=1 Tax=Habropoda laboriosa TaxID=597456 RepID=A0A0L7QTR0_9HYME|nr:PREDICTED: zinc finger protein 501 [Habropoda laboriosa]KOC61939.1 Transcription factor IIIA [Habropoda laboriosa]
MGQDKNSESNSVLSESENHGALENAVVSTETKKDVKPHKCTFAGCDAAFRRPSKLARHIRYHTGERCYKCNHPQCNKAYTNACHLKRHMETHSSIKKLYVCPKCSLHISNAHNLKRHLSAIHGDHNNKLVCQECNETFAKKYQLKAHVAIHSSISYTCDQCNKNFKDCKKFDRHKTNHEKGRKRYPCTMPECNEVFEKWVLLCAHIRTQHVYDYKCTTCGKVFLSKQHLKRHSEVHMESRSVISCPFEKCPRVYYFKRNLTTHIRTYHLEDKYECDICKIKIGTKRRLEEHIQKLHMSEKKIKQIKRKSQRRKRKDAGMPKKSVITKLVGVNLPAKIEKMVLERKDNIPFIEQFAMVLRSRKLKNDYS